MTNISLKFKPTCSSLSLSYPFPSKFHLPFNLIIYWFQWVGMDCSIPRGILGAYHSNPINIFIHILFVWAIFFTMLMLFYYTPFFYSFSKCPCGFNTGFVLKCGFLLPLLLWCCLYTFWEESWIFGFSFALL